MSKGEFRPSVAVRALTATIACAVALGSTVAAVSAQTRTPLVPVPQQYAAEKCADVEYYQAGLTRIEAGTAYEAIRAVLTFADGHREQALFPYPWVYANAYATDPWTAAPPPKGAVYVRVAVQRPPAGFDLSTLPPQIALVLAHTDERGFVDLPGCSGAAPPMTESDLNRILWRSADRNTAAAQIEITRKYFYYGTEYLPRSSLSGYAGPYTYDGECVSFVNRAPRTATRVRFVFTYLGTTGTVLGSDPLERRGSFAPNVLIEGLREGLNPNAIPMARMMQNCVRPPNGDMRGSVFELRTADRQRQVVSGIRVSVEAVDYDDGTTWRAEPEAVPAPIRP